MNCKFIVLLLQTPKDPGDLVIWDTEPVSLIAKLNTKTNASGIVELGNDIKICILKNTDEPENWKENSSPTIPINFTSYWLHIPNWIKGPKKES